MNCKNNECDKFKEAAKALCQRCILRRWRRRNPIRNAYHNLKSSAHKRKIPFLLTWDEFKQWCADTGYVESKGRTHQSSTVGRLDANKGYSLNNMKLEKWIENTSKGYEEGREKSMVPEPITDDEREENPF